MVSSDPEVEDRRAKEEMGTVYFRVRSNNGKVTIAWRCQERHKYIACNSCLDSGCVVHFDRAVVFIWTPILELAHENTLLCGVSGAIAVLRPRLCFSCSKAVLCRALLVSKRHFSVPCNPPFRLPVRSSSWVAGVYIICHFFCAMFGPSLLL